MNLLVVGSINIDYVSFVYEFPKKGETISTLDFIKNNGGKGANQAIAAKRLSKSNNSVSLFAKIGNDSKEEILESLKKDDIKCDNIYISDSKPTGMASIFVSKTDNDNMIVINGGANLDFSPKDEKNLEKAIKHCDVVLLQLETNEWLSEKTIEIASNLNKKIIVNPSPASNFKKDWISKINWLVLNETELEYISDQQVGTLKDVEKSSDFLKIQGCENIIVTLGENGAYLNSEKIKKHFNTNSVEIVDTTAAGDTFVGGFVQELFNSKDPEKAILYGMRAAEITISRLGAQKSIPNAKEVKNAGYKR